MPSTRGRGRTGTRGRATKVVANVLLGGGRKRVSRKVNDSSSSVSENTNVEDSGKNVELIKKRKTTLADISDTCGDDPQAISVETAVGRHDIALDSGRKNVLGNEIDEEVDVEGERVNGDEAVPERGVSSHGQNDWRCCQCKLGTDPRQQIRRKVPCATTSGTYDDRRRWLSGE